MRILVTNDDGVDAPGLAILETIAASQSNDVWVLAPETEQSGQARAMSMHRPLRLREIGPKRYSLSGTPCDCILVALSGGLEDTGFDLVLSGVNHGQNLAEDTGRSGTVGAAMQAMQMGVKAIAFSQACGFFSGRGVPWQTAQDWGIRILDALLRSGWQDDVALNVNFPDRDSAKVGGVEITFQGQRDHHPIAAFTTDRQTFHLEYSDRLSNPVAGSDLRAIYEGRISITPLHADMTHQKNRQSLHTCTIVSTCATDEQ